jgi:hypothetical protein
MEYVGLHHLIETISSLPFWTNKIKIPLSQKLIVEILII